MHFSHLVLYLRMGLEQPIIVDTKTKATSQLLMGGFYLRISPQNNDVYQNPEEPEDEDEDVQMERMRTANALVSTSFDEVST